MDGLEQVLAIRTFNTAYIWLDAIFLVIFSGLLIVSRKWLTLVWAFAGGILYTAVDFGIFYLATGSREVYIGGQLQGWQGTLLVLIWMSMSYGMTNFAWIWLCLQHDMHLKEWTVLIMCWWIACPMLAKMFTDSAEVKTVRTTAAYHGIMGLILFVSYLAVIIYNLLQKEKELRIRTLWLCVIGIAVQFGWEFALLIGGIRNIDITMEEKIRTLIVNSLVETNLGLPLMYLIFIAVTSKVSETFKRKHDTMKATLLANNNGVKL